MLYYFLYPLRDTWFIFNIFRYITFRTVFASMTAFLICVWIAPLFIAWLKRIGMFSNNKRQHAEPLHNLYAHKEHVPTMGGLFIVLSIVSGVLLWGNLQNRFVLLALIMLIGFMVVGVIDDWLKAKHRSTRGLFLTAKLVGEILLGCALGLYLFWDPHFSTLVYVPFVKNVAFSLGVLYIGFVVLVLVGTSNALNLTDGLDGLAIGCFIFAAGCLGVMSYVSGHYTFAQYLHIPFMAEGGELTVFCGAMVGAAVGFLWFNSYPATIMMGDAGSLPLGGALGAVAILIKKELVLLIVGGIFVWEALSVILQVCKFRLTGKRLFLMAPYHHHLQLKGWPESKVTIRLWIIALMLAMIGLSTLKIR